MTGAGRSSGSPDAACVCRPGFRTSVLTHTHQRREKGGPDLTCLLAKQSGMPDCLTNFAHGKMAPLSITPYGNLWLPWHLEAYVVNARLLKADELSFPWLLLREKEGLHHRSGGLEAQRNKSSAYHLVKSARKAGHQSANRQALRDCNSKPSKTW